LNPFIKELYHVLTVFTTFQSPEKGEHTSLSTLYRAITLLHGSVNLKYNLKKKMAIKRVSFSAIITQRKQLWLA